MDLSFEGINLNNLNIATLASAVERGNWKRSNSYKSSMNLVQKILNLQSS